MDCDEVISTTSEFEIKNDKIFINPYYLRFWNFEWILKSDYLNETTTWDNKAKFDELYNLESSFFGVPLHDLTEVDFHTI